jgi:hypothetical protein
MRYMKDLEDNEMRCGLRNIHKSWVKAKMEAENLLQEYRKLDKERFQGIVTRGMEETVRLNLEVENARCAYRFADGRAFALRYALQDLGLDVEMKNSQDETVLCMLPIFMDEIETFPIEGLEEAYNLFAKHHDKNWSYLLKK